MSADPIWQAVGHAGLPRALEAFHTSGASRWRGQARVVRGTHPLARLACWLGRFPPSGEVDLTIDITQTDTTTDWRRMFG